MKNKEKITKEKIEEVFKEVFKDMPPLLEKCEWIEDGKICHTWKINSGKGIAYTNDAGAEMIHQAMKDEIIKNYGNEKK